MLTTDPIPTRLPRTLRRIRITSKKPSLLPPSTRRKPACTQSNQLQVPGFKNPIGSVLALGL
jgi:hypothetical protein